MSSQSSEISTWSETCSQISIEVPRKLPHRCLNQISKQFLPLIAALRIFGPYPILLKADNPLLCCRGSSPSKSMTGNEVLYEFCCKFWKNPIILYSFVLTAINIFCWMIFIFNQGLGLPFPVDLVKAPEIFKTPNEVGVNSVTNRISTTAEGIIKTLETIIIFFNSKSFVAWVNNWNIFEHGFTSYFAGKNIVLNFEMRQFQRHVLTFYFLVPSIFWVCLSTYVVMYDRQLCPKYPLVFIYTVWVNVLLMGHTLLEDYKTLLMLKTLQVAFLQIRDAIRKDCLGHLITYEDVIAWRQLIHQIRYQVQLCSDNLKCRQLILLLESVLGFSLGVLLAEDYAVNDRSILSQRCFLVSIVSLCIIGFIRMYSMTLMAENIYSEERALSTEFVEMQVSVLDTRTRMELKFTYLMITQSPSMIDLGNYIKVNKNLLIRVAIQVLTFTIALMQFNTCLRREPNSTSK